MKARNTLFLINAILGIVVIVIAVLLSMYWFDAGSETAREYYMKAMQQGQIDYRPYANIREAADALCLTANITGGLCLGVAVLIVPSIVISFIARVKNTKIINILAIIFGALGGTLCLIAGILGLVNKDGDTKKIEDPVFNELLANKEIITKHNEDFVELKIGKYSYPAGKEIGTLIGSEYKYNLDYFATNLKKQRDYGMIHGIVSDKAYVTIKDNEKKMHYVILDKEHRKEKVLLDPNPIDTVYLELEVTYKE